MRESISWGNPQINGIALHQKNFDHSCGKILAYLRRREIFMVVETPGLGIIAVATIFV
jgi:hypothetical protein